MFKGEVKIKYINRKEKVRKNIIEEKKYIVVEIEKKVVKEEKLEEEVKKYKIKEEVIKENDV